MYVYLIMETYCSCLSICSSKKKIKLLHIRLNPENFLEENCIHTEKEKEMITEEYGETVREKKERKDEYIYSLLETQLHQ